MAANLQLLKRRIKTSKNIAQIAKAMEMISASKIKRAQDATAANKPYASRIENITTSLLLALKETEYTHPYLKKNTSDITLIVVVSPDKGLCGSLNANLYKKILEENSNGKSRIIAVGRKAEQFVAARKMDLHASFAMGTTIPSYGTSITVKDMITEEFLAERVGRVVIIYSAFESFFSQVPVVKQLLPTAAVATEDQVASLTDYTFEPDAQSILDSLLPYYLETQLYQAFIEAYTSEQAARMMAMQNAKNSALDIADYLTLTYNKVRQERITNEILDLNNSKLIGS